MNRYCQVKNCNYKFSHTTIGHKCGKCNSYGHGQNECHNKDMLDSLKIYFTDTMPLLEQCSAKTCNYRKTHSIEAHFCQKCSGRHSFDECDFYKQMPQCQKDEARKIMSYHHGKIYVKLWIGMGEYAFYKRDDVGKLVTSLSCQYDKINSYDIENFIKGYTNINDIIDA